MNLYDKDRVLGVMDLRSTTDLRGGPAREGADFLWRKYCAEPDRGPSGTEASREAPPSLRSKHKYKFTGIEV